MKPNLMLLMLLAPIAAVPPLAVGQDQTQKPTQLTVKVPVEINYLLSIPKNYDKQDSWPLLVFLHGSGERGDDLEMVKKHGPPKLIAEGKELPFIVASPQCPKGKGWEPLELLALIDDLSSKFKVDADRVYVTGLSMGGFGTWRLAAFAPGRLAAIVPICGGGEPTTTRMFSNLPVWAFHGAKDTAVTLDRSQVMIDALKKNGGNPKFTVYPDAGHDSWTEAYNNPELYEWLLAQKRVKQ